MGQSRTGQVSIAFVLSDGVRVKVSGHVRDLAQVEASARRLIEKLEPAAR